jgi:tRNA1(Val) A37 N6-methylase TrmN6
VTEIALTEDHLLGGRVVLRQPAKGYRVGIDPLLLAAAVTASAGERILDVGSGVGAAALAVAVRVAGTLVTGLEQDRPTVGLAAANAQANGVADRVQFFICNLKTLPVRLSPGIFDHVMTNPPHLAEGTGRLPENEQKARSTIESDVFLDEWLQFCIKMVRPKGFVTVIHRADRLHEVLAALHGRLGDLTVYPLWPGGSGDKSAKRVIIRGRRGTAGPLTLLPGLVLHAADGSYTDAAEAILRRAAPLPW